MYNSVTPNLMVEDVNKTIDFYSRVFGFEAVITVPDEGDLDFAIVSKDGVELMFQKRASLQGEIPEFEGKIIGGTFALYFDVYEIKPLYNKAKANCDLVQDMHKTFYGTDEFSVKDLNGYILTFSEREDFDDEDV